MQNHSHKTNVDVQQRVQRQKFSLLKDFLENINCQILRFYSNPTVPSNIVFSDIFRSFFFLYRPEQLLKLANTQTNGQTSRKHGKHTKKPTKFYTAKTQKTKQNSAKNQEGVKVEPASKLSLVSGNYL